MKYYVRKREQYCSTKQGEQLKDGRVYRGEDKGMLAVVVGFDNSSLHFQNKTMSESISVVGFVLIFPSLMCSK